MANTYQGACGRVPGVRPGANFKEAVCIDTNRVYDSVSDKNCLEDLQVTFPDEAQSIVNNCCSLKLKEVEVENVYMDVEPIPFNKGFYPWTSPSSSRPPLRPRCRVCPAPPSPVSPPLPEK